MPGRQELCRELCLLLGSRVVHRGGLGIPFAGKSSSGLGLTLFLTLPCAQPSRRSKESPSDMTALHQTPGEGAELLPCHECHSRLGSVLSALVLQPSSRAIASQLLPLLSCPMEDIKCQEPGDLIEGQAKVRMAAVYLPLAVLECQGSLANGMTFSGRVPWCHLGT